MLAWSQYKLKTLVEENSSYVLNLTKVQKLEFFKI